MSASVPRIGSAGDFATLRAALTEAGFTESRVAERTGAESIYSFRSAADGREAPAAPRDALDLLIRLFMDALAVSDADLDRWLPAGVPALLRQLDLTAPAGEGQTRPTVLLYPVEGVYVASDLTNGPDGSRLPMADDIVYAAITSNTGKFLRHMTRQPSQRLLELCGGTGIAALVGARNAGHAWSLDITARSTLFARFNGALNGFHNFTALEGDLYQPVQGLTFDRIVAHPPYVPTVEQKMIYRDGGADGEQVTRRIIAGLPTYLEAGGRAHLTCVATDRTGAPLEQRVREMLGERHDEFDVLVTTALEYEPLGYFTRTALEGRMEWPELQRTLEVQRDLRIERMVYSHIEVQRRAASRPTFTCRRVVGPRGGWQETDWLLGWETRSAAGDEELLRVLFTGAPRVPAGVAVEVEMRQDEPSNWTPQRCVVRVESPFQVRIECPVWTADLLATCTGAVTVAQLHERLGLAAGMADTEGAVRFLHFVRTLAGAGILEFDGLPLPPVREFAKQGHPVA
ncbi:MAG TPA: methyltransferase [Gemmatimonadales bacterium]|nr:methyltransferase [Gemmatimonadales bacterium]